MFGGEIFLERDEILYCFRFIYTCMYSFVLHFLGHTYL